MKHVEASLYFDFPVENKMWVGRTIEEGKTMKLEFSFLVASNFPIQLLVSAVGIDLIDHGLIIEYEVCQAIQSEACIHCLWTQNKFSEDSMTKFLFKRFLAIQKRVYTCNKDSVLGSWDAAGKKFPTIVIKKDCPYNSIWNNRKECDVMNTWNKFAWILQYATKHTDIVEMASKIYCTVGRSTMILVIMPHVCMLWKGTRTLMRLPLNSTAAHSHLTMQ